MNARGNALPLEPLLDSLLANIEYVPAGARRLTRRELPPQLELYARQSIRNVEPWRAWADGARICLVTAKLSPALSQQLGRPALHVFFYEADGRLGSSAVWVQDSADSWRLRDVTGATSRLRKLDAEAMKRLSTVRH